MKKVMVGLMVVMMGLLLMAPMANANVVAGDYITPTLGMAGGTNGGGDFNISKGGVLQFTTFCVEESETFSPGSQYYVGSITTNAINGGTAGPNPDPLSTQTAYLFNKWASAGITNNAAEAITLQLAIWYLEGELTASNPNLALYNASAAAQAYVSEANSNANGTLYNVWVMNLYNSEADYRNGTGLAQDMLIQGTPIPAAVWLLGSALLGLVGVRRRKNG